MRRPNVVLIVLDDMGFAQPGCFGSGLDTPTMDVLAARGLRYNRFHVTALCSPTRASLLTGRNHHRVGMGWLTDIPTSAPGYTAYLPATAGTLPRILRDAGYSTFAVGKWHLTPAWARNAAGPYDRWPLGLGFERFYGFLGAETNQWTPALVADNTHVAPDRSPQEGYHLTEDLADRAIHLIQDQQQARPDHPFFLYFALGAMHAPHQAPPQWIEPYRGRFDAGWESWRAEIVERQRASGIVPPDTNATPRPPWVQPWDELSNEEQRLCARGMEVFAGFLSHTDAQIGRVLQFLDELGQLDDTIVMLLSDNGTSPEGGLVGSLNYHRVARDHLADKPATLAGIDELGGFRSYSHYPWGWAWAGNTPFWLWKKFTWLGGVRTPLLVQWPNGITAAGGVRSQFCHAVDVLPTVLDVCGVDAPRTIDGIDQLSFDGASIADTFASEGAPSPRSTQYFEMVGSRSIYCDGWKATTDHVGPTPPLEHELIPGSHSYDDDHWALFRLDEDFAEANDVSSEHPDVVRRLVELWWAEAGRNQVLPLDDGWLGRANPVSPPFPIARARTLRPGASAVGETVLPSLRAGFALTADLTVAEPAQGVLCALGDWNQGWAWYVTDGRLVFACTLFSVLFRVASDARIASGEHRASLEYRTHAPAGGTVALALDGDRVAELEIPNDFPGRWQQGHPGLFVGRDEGFPVCDDYTPPFPFNGTLHRLALEVPDPASTVAPDPTPIVAEAVRHD
jgi:arylsulfatase A-like enzyme